MKIIFVSDNYFLTSGMQQENISTVHIENKANTLSESTLLSFAGKFIVAIESLHLRNKLIMQLKKYKQNYIVLLPDVAKNKHFKFGSVIFSSLNATPKYIQKIAYIPTESSPNKLTMREKQVLSVFHLKNTTIARIFSISQKTVSGYRISILYKLKIKSKNNIAMLRIQDAIAQCNTSPLSTHLL
jgi:DNA-binding CsgD family transcriptional regulator